MKKQSHKKLTKYLAGSAAVLAGSVSTSDAAIVYGDVNPDVLVDTAGAFGLDMDGDTRFDFAFIGGSNASSAWYFVRGFGAIGTSVGGPNNQFVGYAGAFLPYASALSAGSVGSSLSFVTDGSGGNNDVWIASQYGGGTYGAWG